MEQRRKNLTQLFIPICLETLLYMLSGMVDTLMLSSVNDQAVGAVGTANTYIGIFIIMFSVISSGMVAVMTQNIGAGRPGVAYQARQLGLAFNAVLGVIMSLFLSLGAGTILSGVGVADAPGENLSADRGRILYFKCTDSDLFELSSGIWVFERTAVCIHYRKCH